MVTELTDTNTYPKHLALISCPIWQENGESYNIVTTEMHLNKMNLMNIHKLVLNKIRS